MSKQTIILVILDGWGIGRDDAANPIYAARPQTINLIKNRYQSGALQASGIAVGLPWGEEGNSEVGHLTIGSGKVLYQHYPRVTLAIQDKSFFKNRVLLKAADHAVKNQSAVNLIGLLSEGNVHASLSHLNALIKLIRSVHQSVPIKLHAFSDGKDGPPQSILRLLPKIAGVKIASLSGRYFAMDRDRHWDRTQEAYQAIVGQKETTDDLAAYVQRQYNRGLTDEYLPPVSVNPESAALTDNDAVIFFNFREDSIRQLAAAFVQKNFREFAAAPLKNLYRATLTQYSDQFSAAVAFPSEKVENSLGKVLADNGKFQLRIAETEKYAHVTYFFNGLTDRPIKNEFRVLFPSRNVIHHDEHPEMMAREIADRVIQAIEDREMDFILVNFANPDIIAHTGNFAAAVAAVKIIDEQINKISKAALAADAALMITADHGNIERMINPITGAKETKHDSSPVPFYLVGKRFESRKNAAAARRAEAEPAGVLSDVAPTVLELMKIAQPPEMTGQSLVGRLY